MDEVAERAADAAPVLAECAQNIEVWLGGAFAEKFHLLRHGKTNVLDGLYVIVAAREERTGRQREDGKVIVEELSDAHVPKDFHFVKEECLQESSHVDEWLGLLGLECRHKGLARISMAVKEAWIYDECLPRGIESQYT